MVVFIMPRNVSFSNAGDIQKEIEDATGFNEMCEHNKEYCERKTEIFKRSETPIINIHPDVKKKDGQTLTVNEIPEHEAFGNGVHSYQMKLNNGERIEIVSIVFPHSSEGSIRSKLAQLKTICMRQ